MPSCQQPVAVPGLQVNPPTPLGLDLSSLSSPLLGCFLPTLGFDPKMLGAPTRPPSRLRMVETLSNLLRSVVALSPPDLLPILYLSLNRLGPPQQGLELGVGDGVLLKAVAQATGKQGVWWPFKRRGLREKGKRWEHVRGGRGLWRWGEGSQGTRARWNRLSGPWFW